MQKGSQQTEEAKEKMSLAKKEKPTRYWKGKKFSEEHRKKLSDAKKGKPGNNQTKGKRPWNKGKKLTEEHRKKLSENSHGKNAGEKCTFWEGGKQPQTKIWRKRSVYRKWRNSCLERDNHQCQKCFSKEGLHVHHIKGWDEYPYLRFEIKNGITYCRSCHSKCHWDQRKGKVSHALTE